MTFRREQHRKHRFHSYSPIIPRPLYTYTLPREPVTEQLPSDSPGIVVVYTGRYQATHVPSRDHCIATVLHVIILTDHNAGNLRVAH
jgi:hypothetical protein